MSNDYYVYIVSNKTDSTVYIGMTHDLEKRLYEHKNHLAKGSFTDKYNCYKLVYYEWIDDYDSALAREKQIKKWNRNKKNKLINSINPEWKDLSLKWYK